jgi:ABC-type Na+ efflux pump permease subunit
MKKIALIATREFLTTVGTRAFILGLLMTPAIIAVAAIVFPRIVTRSVQVQGEVAVIDRTGALTSELRIALDPQRITARRAEQTRQALTQAPETVRTIAGQAERRGPGDAAAPAPNGMAEMAFGGVPDLSLRERPAAADPQQEKIWLTDDLAKPRRLALVVIHADAVVPQAGQSEYGTYDLYVPKNLDDRIETEIYQSLREAIISARVKAQSLDRAKIDSIIRVNRVASVTVTKTNERQTVAGFNVLLPAAFAMLMFIGVMTGGQALLTSTVEEKSSRVIEIILSAVSPMELLAGKLLGQMAVSLLALALYLAMGIAMLVSFAILGLLNPWLLVYLFIFFVISYLVLGSMMLTVGAVVNDMREAQSMMMPIMLLIMTPWIFWFPISREPNSTFSTVISFIPPVNTFTMLLRMTSNAPPPWWQVWVSIAIGVMSVVAALWFAAKVFRIGLLMYGKPPNFATMIRWARAA